jgi:hypothetical protein
MKSLCIKPLLAIAICFGIYLSGAQESHAWIPDVRVCVVNEETQAAVPGVWVRWTDSGPLWWRYQNDAEELAKRVPGVRYSKTGSDGCVVFTPGEKNEAKNKRERIDTDGDGSLDAYRYHAKGQPDTFYIGNFGCHANPMEFAVMPNIQWPGEFSTVGGNRTVVPNDPSRPTNADCDYCFQNSKDATPVTLTYKPDKKASAAETDVAPEEAIAASDKQGFACLQTELCSEDSVSCSNETAQQQDPPANASVERRVKLVNVGELRRKLITTGEDSPVWIIECILEGVDSFTCTTGNAAEDQKLFGTNNLASLQSAYNYSSEFFDVAGDTTKKMAQPVTQDNTTAEIEWVTRAGNTSSIFMLAYSKDNSRAPNLDALGGQQQATLSFQDGCQLIHDPFGRVFDSLTLEPLSGVDVTLTKKMTDGSYKTVTQSDVSASPQIGSITNPQKTIADGIFSFYVPDGTYRLSAQKSGYAFPAGTMNYAASDFYMNLYQGEDIVQKGKIEQRDIPMQPLDEAQSIAYARQNPITVIDHFETLDKERNTYTLEGRVSHPRASVIIYAQVPNKRKPGTMVRTRELARTEADPYGQFKILIDTSNLKSGEIIGELEAKKKPVPNLQGAIEEKNPVSAFIQFVTSFIQVEADERAADTTVIQLNPILNYIEGYAVTEGGQIIPGATVGVYLQSSNRPMYETTADESGFFRIYSEYLPSIPYELRFNGLSDSQTAIRTAAFIAENSAVNTDRTNYYAFNASPENKAVLGEFTSVEDLTITDSEIATTTFGSQSKPGGVTVVIAVVLMVFIIIATSLLGLYVTQLPKRRIG